jgi:hypothetical protein
MNRANNQPPPEMGLEAPAEAIPDGVLLAGLNRTAGSITDLCTHEAVRYTNMSAQSRPGDPSGVSGRFRGDATLLMTD